MRGQETDFISRERSWKAIVDWEITDSEIQGVERLLLPADCHFDDDAVNVIRCWNSADVSACPGSGKTTVLLAKLKLLADRMPLENGAGICVLSHTNVAVNEIKKKLSGYADKLMSYPNYVGTIQSFIDRFVTMPYLRGKTGQSAQPVDKRTYAEYILKKMGDNAYSKFSSTIRMNYKNSNGRYTDPVEYVAKVYRRVDGALCIEKRKNPLAGADTPSAKQCLELKRDILLDKGIMLYQDTYQCANNVVEELSPQYTDLFSLRFGYVLVDEYQDCTEIQRIVLRKLFDPSKCVVIHIGDEDQAIYSSDSDDTADWQPEEGFLSLSRSNRYGQKIADILSPLRKNKIGIRSSSEEGFSPVLIIYKKDTIDRVLGKFVSLLEEKGLHDVDGTYKAIGFIKKEDSAGINIGSYWSGFDSIRTRTSELRYWELIDDICIQLRQGKLYRAEFLMRKLICRLFHYANITNGKSGKEHTLSSIRTTLKDNYSDIYTGHILELSLLADYNRESVDGTVRAMFEELFRDKQVKGKGIFQRLPDYFMEDPESSKENIINNVFIDPIRGRHIQFDTVHNVKGETHDATLYLETENQKNSDIGRILCRYGVGKVETSPIFDYSRKIVYVGMSRPRKLLCVAIQESTYQKGKEAFEKWEKVFVKKEDKIMK